MSRNTNGHGIRPVNAESQLAVIAEHVERVKDMAICLSESRGIWTASAAQALASYFQDQADAALKVLHELKR
jgi:hypothetical protein